MQGFTELTEEQRQQFRDEGYLIVRNVLDDVSISRLIEAGDRIIAKEDRFNRFQTNGGLYDGYRNCITMDDAFIPLLTNGKVTLPLVIQLLGSNSAAIDQPPHLSLSRSTGHTRYGSSSGLAP